MHSADEDFNSRIKLAQLWHVARHTPRTISGIVALQRVVNEILTDDVNLNCKVTIHPDNESWEERNIHLQDCTALHFMCHNVTNITAFTILLERRADFTIKNGNGQTPLHLSITAGLKIISSNRFAQNHIPFINAVLSAHVKHQNSINPRDNNGISHLHGACMTNHVEAVELFLDNGASVDEVVNVDAPNFAGYTPLHFAVEFHSFEVAQILVRRDANVSARNAKGMNPLDMLVERRLDKLDDMSGLSVEDDDSTKACWKEIFNNEQMIKLLLDKHCFPAVGLSNFHVACTLKDLTYAERLLNEGADIDYAVPMTSPICPGNTALHFAANNSIEAVKLLLMRGAKIDITNVRGLTPLDLFMNNFNLCELCNILSSDESWNGVCLSDGKTRLLDFVEAASNVDELKLFLEGNKHSAIPNDSSILPGCTILHLAVIFSTLNKSERANRQKTYDENIVKECLAIDVDINVQNARGQTPVHLAYRLGKDNIVRLLLERLKQFDHVVNILDDDNLSYLHIACAMVDEVLVGQILVTSTPNVAYTGRSILRDFIEVESTPLHIATARGSRAIVHVLLVHGADLHAADGNGMTPIHWILLKLECPVTHQEVIDVLLNSLLEKPEDRVVDKVGLTYLHVACYGGHLNSTVQLLRAGSNVNAVISHEDHLSTTKRLADFRSCTPLHMALMHHPAVIVKLLLRCGANVFAKVSDFNTRVIRSLQAPIILKNKDITRLFMSHLWDQRNKDFMRKLMERKWGLTQLHVACHMKNEEAIKAALHEGADVNAKVREDFDVFAGCTPLHLLVNISKCDYYNFYPPYALESMMRLLLERGADVTIANVEKDTPIHEFSYYLRYFTDANRCKTLLLNGHKDFGINPANIRGISHFHLACEWHVVEAVEKFLHHGSVNIDQPTDLFAGYSTPLHSTLRFGSREPDQDWTKVVRIVQMLLSHGANVDARDADGNLVIHKSAVSKSPRMCILDELVKHGADVNSKNVRGETIFDKRTDTLVNVTDYARLIMKYGCRINTWNNVTGEGYIAKIFLSYNRNTVADSTEFQSLVQSSDVKEADELGRTVIHNCVASLPPVYDFIDNYNYVIGSFIGQGVDIDYQDKSGQTALHYAVRMENQTGVAALLNCGADIDIVDTCGMPALSHFPRYGEGENTLSDVIKMFRILNFHVQKLHRLGLVSELNRNLAINVRSMLSKTRHPPGPIEDNPNNFMQLFLTQLELTKTMDVGVGSLTLFDFLNGTNRLTLYPYLPICERSIVDGFFETVVENEISELVGIVKLQFRKMKTRLEWIDSALSSLKLLLGFSVPGLCEEIARFLTNSDLKNLAACF